MIENGIYYRWLPHNIEVTQHFLIKCISTIVQLSCEIVTLHRTQDTEHTAPFVARPYDPSTFFYMLLLPNELIVTFLKSSSRQIFLCESFSPDAQLPKRRPNLVSECVCKMSIFHTTSFETNEQIPPLKVVQWPILDCLGYNQPWPAEQWTSHTDIYLSNPPGP